METLTQTNASLPVFRKGKVRDTYVLDDTLLMVSTDRLSAFDVVFNEGIPEKGAVLNNLSIFWFNQTRHIIPNHFISDQLPKKVPKEFHRRSMIVKKSEPLKIECIVRGYLTGSGWKDYQKTGKVCGITLPQGLKNGSELPEPIFTPSTKADAGHDANITADEAKKIVGEDTFNFVREKAIEIYKFGKVHANKCGLILVDTKFEFGHLTAEDGRKSIILIDECMTPDSSRYWIKADYDAGKLTSLDKQYVRDYLETLNWNKTPPPPPLPEDIVQKTTERYLQAYKMLTGKELK